MHDHSYQQRSLLILLPLMLLALITWLLDAQNTPHLPYAVRNYLIQGARIILPGLCVLCAAFMVPLHVRMRQLGMTALSYTLLLILAAHWLPDIGPFQTICVLSASVSLLAMLPGYAKLSDRYMSSSRLSLLSYLSALLLPFIFMYGAIVILRQAQLFISLSFDSMVSNEYSSLVCLPIYIILQAFGFQDHLTNLAALTSGPITNALTNSLVMTELISVPAILLARAVFARPSMRLFIAFTALTVILTSSIGACQSLILLIMIIFFPGTFIVLLSCSMLQGLCSYLWQLPAIYDVNLLYRPDFDFNALRTDQMPGTLKLCWLAALMPVLLLCTALMIRNRLIYVKKLKRRMAAAGIVSIDNTQPDLAVLSLLRALGGISNIYAVNRESGLLFFHIANQQAVIAPMLSALCRRRPVFNRLTKTYRCDIGANSYIIEQRLKRLIDNGTGAEEFDIPVAQAFVLRPIDKNIIKG